MACAGLLAAFAPVLTWVNHVNNLVGTRGYGGGDGFVEHGAVFKHASDFVEFPADTDFGSVKVTFTLFDKRAPCVLSDFILDIAARHPHVPCFQIRLPFAEYGMQRSRAWCGTPPILGVVNMVRTRNFTCYMGAL